jgi:hypothetical protein
VPHRPRNGRVGRRDHEPDPASSGTGGIAYRLDHFRDDAVAVVVAAPGERWEIEFLADGTLDVEVFTSDGTIHGAEKLADLSLASRTTEQALPRLVLRGSRA